MNLDASEIVRGLYVGSLPAPGDELARHGFDILVLCAAEYQPHEARFPGVRVIHAPFEDRELGTAALNTALLAAQSVAALRARGCRVLVTCIEGRNRSALVAGLALHVLTGRSGQSISRLIRRRRRPASGPALTNPHFRRLLERQVQRPPPRLVA